MYVGRRLQRQMCIKDKPNRELNEIDLDENNKFKRIESNNLKNLNSAQTDFVSIIPDRK